MNTETQETGMLHLFMGGRTYDIPCADLDIGDLSTDDQIRLAVANHLEFPVSKLAVFDVDKAEGNISVRARAEFGLKTSNNMNKKGVATMLVRHFHD